MRSYPQHYSPYDAVGCCVNSFQQFQQRRSHVRPPLGLQSWPDFARGSTPHQQNRVLANLNCRSKLPKRPRPKVPPTTLHCCPSQIPLLHGSKARQAGLHPRNCWEKGGRDRPTLISAAAEAILKRPRPSAPEHASALAQKDGGGREGAGGRATYIHAALSTREIHLVTFLLSHRWPNGWPSGWPTPYAAH